MTDSNGKIEEQASLKDQGNQEYKAGNFLKAAALYTKAIKDEPSNHILFSNRSAALLKLSKATKALTDAEECIRLKPDWDKGYFRKAAALEIMEKHAEALQAYQEALKLNPENKEVATKIRALNKFIRQSNHANNKTATAV